MSSFQPVLFGSVGLGGYAGAISSLLESQSKPPDPLIKLVAVCEPDQALHAKRIEELKRHDVQVFDNYQDLLRTPIEAVWLPMPIDLHRPFTEQALAAGKAVMCEKPAAGSVDDLDAMIAARDRHKLPAAIGFQHIYDPATLPLKRRLLAGRLGTIRSVQLYACWPRDSRYYGRSTWAGKLKRNGVWVLDSPANNALAHYINLVLFLLGPSAEESAIPESVEAELYRANPIENYDTCCLRTRVAGGAEVLIYLTHACAETVDPTIQIIGEKDSLRFAVPGRLPFDAAGDPINEAMDDTANNVFIVQRFARHIRKLPDDGALATLEVARSHLVLINGASEAAKVRDVPAAYIREVHRPSGATVRAIQDIEEIFRACAEKKQTLHESGLAPWSTPAGPKDLRGYRHFAGPRE